MTLICLFIWITDFPVGRTVWEGLWDMDLLEKMCHWGQALRFQNPTAFLWSYLSLLLFLPPTCGERYKLSANIQHHACLLPCSLSWSLRTNPQKLKSPPPNKLFLYKLLLTWHITIAVERYQRHHIKKQQCRERQQRHLISCFGFFIYTGPHVST